MTMGRRDSSVSLKDCMESAIFKSGKNIDDIDLIIPEGNGNRQCDHIEAAAISELFNEQKHTPPVIIPKMYYGHLYGASASMDIVCGLLSMETGIVPPVVDYEQGEIKDLNIAREKTLSEPVNNILINSRSREGVNVSFVISRYKA
jgi:3-oxoacyl-[acyl-carrier-protein] synthase II